MAVFRNATLLKFVSNAFCRSEPMFIKFYSKKTTPFMDGPVDPEIKFHAKLAQSWWDMEIFRSLHNLNEVRVPFIREGIHQLMPPNADSPGSQTELEGVNILDVGCGGGILSEALARLKANVTGLDPSPDLIRIAREHAEFDPQLKNYLRYECDVIHHFCQKTLYGYDAIVVSEVIEHISNKQQFIEDCLSCLKPGGSIFFTTPNKTFLSRLIIIHVAERIRAIPRGTHHYQKFISVEDLSKVLNAYDCSIRRVEGIFYNVWTRKFRFSTFNHVLYALHAQKAG